MPRFQKFLVGTIALGLACGANAAEIFPTATGTNWEYKITGGKPETRAISVTLAGPEQLDGKPAFRLETRAGNVLQKTELISVDERGVYGLRRILPGGKTTNFQPPREWFPADLKFGAHWERDEEIDGTEMHLRFTVNVEDDIVVPAGKFHAFLCEAEEPWPISVKIQRWFSPRIGLVKEITTTRGPTGRLLNRATTVLTKFSRPAAPPTSSPNEISSPSLSPAATPAPIKVTLIPSKEHDGEFTTGFRTNAPNIFVRWTGENLPVGSHVRVAWVVDNVGEIAPENFIIDQNETTVTDPKYGAQFTLARPKDGWAAGKYRVELYLDDKLLDTAKVTIRD
ncbi:MAG: hypothetical protein ACR2HH_15330 [Chthoniobacterales bacterium]